MTSRLDTDRILDVYLAPEADRLPDRVIDAALDQIARTPQRRALRVPWRLLTMPALSRAAGIAAVVLVAIVGAGGILYLNSSGSGSSGGQPAPIPTPTPAPTTEPTAPPTPRPSEVAPGITSFTPYTSAVYGITFGYPDGWTLDGAATRKWQEGDGGDHVAGGGPYTDSFMNPEVRDGDQIAMGVWQMTAGSSADIRSRQGLAAWFGANVCDDQIDACETASDVAVPMCVGRVACLPAVLVPLSDSTQAVIADPETGLVTVVSLARPDSFPAAARYGGSVQLLKSILTTMDVWTPEPGQIPSGS